MRKVRRWITMIFLLFSVAFTARIAAQNRKLLRPKLARVRLATTMPTVDPPWTTLFWNRRWELGLPDKLKQFLCERGIEFWELARDGGSRPILLRNISLALVPGRPRNQSFLVSALRLALSADYTERVCVICGWIYSLPFFCKNLIASSRISSRPSMSPRIVGDTLIVG